MLRVLYKPDCLALRTEDRRGGGGKEGMKTYKQRCTVLADQNIIYICMYVYIDMHICACVCNVPLFLLCLVSNKPVKMIY